MIMLLIVLPMVWASGCAQSGLTSECVKPGGIFNDPTNLGPVVNSRYYDGSPCISADGLSLYFDSLRPDGAGDWDIWVTNRETTDSEWGVPEMLPLPINTKYGESGPCISADGLTLYFASSRPGGQGSFDLWVTARETTDESWGEPTNMGPTINSRSQDNHPCISADGQLLYFDSARPNVSGGQPNNDLYVAKRATTADDWGRPANLGSRINTDKIQYSPDILPNGLTMFFDSRITNRDLWMTTRSSVDEDWAQAVSLEPPMNTDHIDTDPSMWVDGCVLYFVSARPGGVGRFDIWQAIVKKGDTAEE